MKNNNNVVKINNYNKITIDQNIFVFLGDTSFKKENLIRQKSGRACDVNTFYQL